MLSVWNWRNFAPKLTTNEISMKKIIILEKTNLKTKKYNDVEMVKKIKRIIEEEVECY